MEEAIMTDPSGYNLSISVPSLENSPIRSLAILQSTLLLGCQSGFVTSSPLSPSPSDSPSHHPIATPHAITALIPLPPSSYACGSKDNLVRIVSHPGHEIVATLRGHSNAVTSLSVVHDSSDTPHLVSGSWDGSARVWCLSTHATLMTLSGHENTVSVLGLSPSIPGMLTVMTSSAGIANGNAVTGYKIRLWNCDLARGVATATSVVEGDHNGPIRNLCGGPRWAASCSNDGTVAVRDGTTGQRRGMLRGFDPSSGDVPPLILDVGYVREGKSCVAVTEDANAFVWDAEGDGNARQTVPHPGCVWTVGALPEGDFATGCQDGVCRVFTMDASRFASEEDIRLLSVSSLAVRKRVSSGPTQEEIRKLPSWENRSAQVGTSHEQVQMFSKDHNKAIAAQWDDRAKSWIEIGEVTGSNPHSGTIGDKQYDYVLPIEVDVPGGGLSNLKIGYNIGQNPFVVAQGFIDEHELSQGYLAQVADYIRERVKDGGVEIGGESGAPPKTNAPAQTTPVPVQTSSYVHIPIRQYLSFQTGADTKSMAKITDKLQQFGYQGPELDSLCQTLAATSRYHSSTLQPQEINVLKTILGTWEMEKAFPALDLARLTVIHPDASNMTRMAFWLEILQLTIQMCTKCTQATTQTKTTSVAIPMLSLRLFANCFKGSNGSLTAITNSLPVVLDITQSFLSSTNKNVRLAVATVILNASTFLAGTPSHPSSSCVGRQIVTMGVFIVSDKKYESEAMIRTLLGLGTVLLANGGDVKRVANEMDVVNVTRGLLGGGYGVKAEAVVQEICTVLGS